MSWGTYYKLDGYLSRIGKHEVISGNKYDECKGINDTLWNEILAYMAMTPPVEAVDEEGNKYPWAEFIAMKIRSYREEIEDNARLMARLDDCMEVYHEHPESVEEG